MDASFSSGDRISWLPEPIIHKILNLLPPKDAARTSVLSREWRCLWWTFLEIIFQGCCRMSVLGYDSRGLEDYLNQRIHHVVSFKMTLFFFRVDADVRPLYPMADRWLSAFVAKNNSDLILNFQLDEGWCPVPNPVLAMESLTALSLCCRAFELRPDAPAAEESLLQRCPREKPGVD
ncbi:hypothetical protein NMG60_11004794 [Bertholletia excelsa]